MLKLADKSALSARTVWLKSFAGKRFISFMRSSDSHWWARLLRLRLGNLFISYISPKSYAASFFPLWLAELVRIKKLRSAEFNLSGFEDPARYVRPIERLVTKYKNCQKLSQPDVIGVSAQLLARERGKIIKFVARCMNDGIYQLASPSVATVRIGSKLREISSYHLIDTVAQGAMYNWLMEDLGRFASPCLYSYLPGRNNRQAVKAFVNYIRSHYDKSGHLDIFVFRADLKSYTDTIPVDASSLLWKYMAELLASKNLSDPACRFVMDFIENALRPIKRTKSGAPYQQCVGIPTGASLTTIAGLLYLSELDSSLAQIPGGFYARFGDDILFAHHDYFQFRQGETIIDETVDRLRLKRNLAKEQRIYYNKAGRDSPAYPAFAGSHVVHYLGYVIYADGSLGIGAAKYRSILVRLRRRAARCQLQLASFAEEERGAALCQALNRMLDVQHPLHENKIGNILANVDNRSCLKELDYRIALMVAEMISGSTGVRAFRTVPYQKIRQQWKLISLCHTKNKG